MAPFDPEHFDFEQCYEEPIHRPELVQGYGYLIAVDPDSYTVQVHSENLPALLAQQPGQGYLGMDFLSVLEPEDDQVDFVRVTCERARSRGVRLPVELNFKSTVIADPRFSRFHAVVYQSDDLMVFEVEPAKSFIDFQQARQLANVYAMAVGPLFERMTEIDEVAAAAADLFRSLTGYERVVVYRFQEDGTGLVISESKVDEVDSYLGLQYPASDIPAQARAIYLENWVRLNPDVDLPTVPLIPSVEESGRAPLDLSKSVVRAMSPIHAQYVRNQGLRSSMSVSLINRGQLWGLISCHHRSSHYIEQAVRIECERMGHLIGWQLQAKEEESAARERAATDLVIDSLLADLSTGAPVIELFQRHTDAVLSVMGAVGFAFCTGDSTERVGETPSDAAIAAILEVAASSEGDEYAVHNLCNAVQDVDFGGICGALVIPMLPKERMYTIWFREEHVRTIRWAGDPAETSPMAPKRQRLMPRESFKVHEQELTGESKPWRSHTIDTAARFNKLFLRHALQSRIELQADVDRLELREQVKNDFLATLAHELRNPLSPITHGVELLESQPNMATEERTHSFAVIKRQLTHLVTLVDDLLELSRITRGKIRVERQHVELSTVLQSATEASRHLRERKRQTLRMEMPEEPIHLHADLTRMTQAFGNVIGNAVKYTPSEGAVDIRVERSRPDLAIIHICDDGVGLTAADIGQIFEMFSQVSPYSPQAGGGLGIGLSLARSLLELHGGTISASSDGPGKGSCFRITLPVLPGEGRGDAAKEPEPAAAAERPRRVMVVDDNPDVADMLAMIAKRRGHDVRVAYTPEEAIESYGDFSPEVVFLDIGLPGMDGVELRHVLAQRSEKPVVFVAQTGWGQASDRERTKNAGFRFHLVKPVKTEQLADVFATIDAAE